MANASGPNPSKDGQADLAHSSAQPEQKQLSEAARRALAEAQERRQKTAAPLPPEINGRGGLEPVRYHDWEVRGLATDF